VAREPVDGTSARVEGHIAGALRRAAQAPHLNPVKAGKQSLRLGGAAGSRRPGAGAAF
jgi:hypothetical protein